MALQIDKINSVIGIDRTPGVLQIKTTPAELELKQNRTKLTITTEKPRVIIDQYPAFASSGLKNTADLTSEAADLGKAAVSKFLDKTVSDGNRLKDITIKQNPIPQFAVRDAYPQKQFGLVSLPSAPIKIDIEGSAKIEFDHSAEGTHNGVEGTYIPGNVDINYTPGNIKIHLQQYASINIRYQPEPTINTTI